MIKWWVRVSGDKTYRSLLAEAGTVEELEEFGNKWSELVVSVRIGHSEGDLRVGLNQTRAQLSQVLESVGIVLELVVLNADLGSLLEQLQVVDQVDAAEGLRGIAARAGKGLDSRKLRVLSAFRISEDIQQLRHQARQVLLDLFSKCIGEVDD